MRSEAVRRRGIFPGQDASRELSSSRFVQDARAEVSGRILGRFYYIVLGWNTFYKQSAMQTLARSRADSHLRLDCIAARASWAARWWYRRLDGRARVAYNESADRLARAARLACFSGIVWGAEPSPYRTDAHSTSATAHQTDCATRTSIGLLSSSPLRVVTAVRLGRSYITQVGTCHVLE